VRLSLNGGFRNRIYRAYKELETREHRLLYLFFELTRRCNLACLHCGSDCERAPSMREMTLETWVSVMDYVKARWDPFIVITGGEPLVRKDLGEITAALKERGLDWGMVTNGFDLDAARLSMLVANGLSSMTISLDGDRERHTYIRRHPQSFDRALEALALLGASGIEHKDAVSCVYPANLDSLESIGKLLVERGITSWRLFRIFPRGGAARHPELILDFAQSRQLIQWIADNRKRFRQLGLELSFSCEGYLPFNLDRKVRTEPFFCRAGINIASILSDGTVTGCNNNGPAFHQGNIRDTDLEALWEKGFGAYRDRSWMQRGVCAECTHWKDCLGGSIHLRDPSKPNTDFCYLKEVGAAGGSQNDPATPRFCHSSVDAPVGAAFSRR